MKEECDGSISTLHESKIGPLKKTLEMDPNQMRKCKQYVLLKYCLMRE